MCGGMRRASLRNRMTRAAPSPRIGVGRPRTRLRRGRGIAGIADGHQLGGGGAGGDLQQSPVGRGAAGGIGTRQRTTEGGAKNLSTTADAQVREVDRLRALPEFIRYLRGNALKFSYRPTSPTASSNARACGVYRERMRMLGE